MLRVLILLVLVAHHEVSADLLPDSQDYTDVPAPLRHWNPNVTLEASTKDTKIPYFAQLRYLVLMAEQTLSDHLAGMKKSCFAEEGASKNIDSSVPGKDRTVVFKSPQITKYKVVHFDKEKNKVQVEFHTTWQSHNVLNDDVNETTTLDEIVKGFQLMSVYNMSFTTVISPTSPSSCPTVEYYPVPDNWCDHGTILYGGKVIQPTRSNLYQRCNIRFSEQVQHYVNMWKEAESLKTIFQKCLDILNPDLDFNTGYAGSVYATLYPVFYPCHKAHNGANSISPPCYDPRYALVEFFENGKGEIAKMDVGRSTTTTDINITVEFDHWTADFVDMFSASFRDCDYNIAATELEVQMFIPDEKIIIARGAPWYLFIEVVLIATPIFVMCLAGFLLSFMRSRKVFRLDVWKWWEDQEKKNKLHKAKETKRDADNDTDNDDKKDLGSNNYGMDSV